MTRNMLEVLEELESRFRKRSNKKKMAVFKFTCRGCGDVKYYRQLRCFLCGTPKFDIKKYHGREAS